MRSAERQAYAASSGRGSARAALWRVLALVALPGVLGACRQAREPVDLLRLGQPAEVAVNGRGWEWFKNQQGKTLRLHDDVRRTLPASPPSRLRYTLDVPRGAHFTGACGIPDDRHRAPGVEFVVKLRRAGREHTLFTQLVDPARHPAHRRFVPFDIDLSEHAGRGVELILETRGFEHDDEARNAYWAAPALTVPGRKAPLVIVYLVDTLRADHTGPYGYARPTTPQLDLFARDAVVFEQAIAHASWTKPSVASLFTSQWPGRHGAVQLRDRLDPALVTLAEMLSAKGYSTGAALANAVIFFEGTSFEQGFDVFTGLHGRAGRTSKDVEAAVVVDSALGFLDAHRGMPSFLYIHTMDPHVPYTPPAPFDRMFEPRPEPGHPGVDPRTDFKEPRDRERLMAQYDGDVAYGDQEFGRFVQALKQRGLYDDALLVFTADHGEEFQDHGKWLHGRSVFDELVRVPLIVKFPRAAQAGRRVAQQVQEVDVLPTILASVGLPVPAPPVIMGLPLQATLEGRQAPRPALSEISHRGFVAHGLRTERDKYVQRFAPDEDELYFDLLADPRELVDRLASARERVRVLKAGVEASMTPNPFRHMLRATGTGRFTLTLRTRGWLEEVQSVGFAGADNVQVSADRHTLQATLTPQIGRPREFSFQVRPRGAPVRLLGTRDGRPLRAEHLWLAAEGVHPGGAAPFALPDVEGEQGDTPENVFAPPSGDRQGLLLWLQATPGHRLLTFGHEAREALRGLGYVGN